MATLPSQHQPTTYITNGGVCLIKLDVPNVHSSCVGLQRQYQQVLNGIIVPQHSELLDKFDDLLVLATKACDTNEPQLLVEELQNLKKQVQSRLLSKNIIGNPCQIVLQRIN